MTERIYIFGAHSRARTLKEYLEKLHPEMRVEAFLVDNEEKNPEMADGTAVIHLSAEKDAKRVAVLDRGFPVYLGLRGVNHPRAIERLTDMGFSKIVPLSVDLDTRLRNQYLLKIFEEKGEPFRKLEAFCPVDNLAERKGIADKLCVYVASSIYDGRLQELHDLKAFERIIQVGCALTDQRLSGAVYDNDGENISARNAQFCELTALYWIWRNAEENYVGLEHYRRFFILPANILEVMEQNEIDVILPVPLYVAPSVEENYRERHEGKIWCDMMDYLCENYPEDAEKARKFFANSLYSPCNMLVARKAVYDRMCEWLFPILFAVAERNGVLEDRYQNRYPGFLSERLMSFYFWKQREENKVVYADKVFLQ